MIVDRSFKAGIISSKHERLILGWTLNRAGPFLSGSQAPPGNPYRPGSAR